MASVARTLEAGVTKPKKPPFGTWIVWRFKDNKGWRKGYVRETFAKGQIVRLTDSEYASGVSGDTVSVSDIDWLKA